jgi:hypothetical protein
MKKSIQWAAGCCAAALLISPVTFAQPSTSDNGTATITVEKVGTVSPPQGFNVCYMPTQRHIEGSRIVQRCGPYGCQNFRVTREFFVTVYQDCHLEKYACPRGYRNFGWYPNKYEARSAMDRCQHTINGNVPSDWRITY